MVITRPEDIDTQGMFRLFDAITASAAMEYVRKRGSSDYNDAHDCRKIENFFRSEWGQMVTGMDPKRAIRTLRTIPKRKVLTKNDYKNKSITDDGTMYDSNNSRSTTVTK